MSHSIQLGVNIDHIATLRQARGTRYPEPIHAALIAEQAGADSITLHLREDRRHIQERDVALLRETLTTRMNLEMAMTPDMGAIAAKIQPSDCCLVPERRAELTTEGGLDVAGQQAQLTDFCAELKMVGVRVSLFIDANPVQVEAAAAVGVPVIELHTGRYADAKTQGEQQSEFKRLCAAASTAHALGLQVNAGHGLHYHNVQAIAAIPEVRELNIGHAIIARALFTGLETAVREMKGLMTRCRE